MIVCVYLYVPCVGGGKGGHRETSPSFVHANAAITNIAKRNWSWMSGQAAILRNESLSRLDHHVLRNPVSKGIP